MKTEILRLERVTTIKDEVTLLDNFNMHIFKSEIMGLVDLNANGKESLIQLIIQNSPIHYGRVYFNEVLVNNYQHSTLTMNKVAIIEQKNRLIEDLTVADNVFVLRRGFKKYFISPRVLNEQLKLFTEEGGIDIDGSELVANLTPYEKCVVELLRAVVLGAKLIVVRDISNSVSTSDLVKFHKLLRYYCQKGFSFLYICNHHEEAFKICTKLSIMKDGKILKVFENNEFQDQNLIPYYIGTFSNVTKVKVNHFSEKGILTFQNVCTDNLKNMTFTIVKGECTAILDMDNTALSDIMQLMNGNMHKQSGEIFFENTIYTEKKARRAIANGVAFIEEDPIKTMLFKEMSYIDNLCFLVDKKQNPVRLGKRIIKSIIHEYEPIVGKDIYESNIMNLKLKSLYDLIYNRIHLCNPKIIFCVQPFAGADMYLRRHIIDLINQFKRKKITVIVLGVRLADSLVIADKLILLEKGEFTSEYPSSQFQLFRSEGIII